MVKIQEKWPKYVPTESLGLDTRKFTANHVFCLSSIGGPEALGLAPWHIRVSCHLWCWHHIRDEPQPPHFRPSCLGKQQKMLQVPCTHGSPPRSRPSRGYCGHLQNQLADGRSLLPYNSDFQINQWIDQSMLQKKLRGRGQGSSLFARC